MDGEFSLARTDSASRRLVGNNKEFRNPDVFSGQTEWGRPFLVTLLGCSTLLSGIIVKTPTPAARLLFSLGVAGIVVRLHVRF